MESVWAIVASVGVAPVLVAAGLLTLWLTNARLQAGGLSLFARRRLRRNGSPARIKVLDTVSRSSMWSGVAYQDYQVVVEVVEGAKAGERCQMTLRWNWEKWGFLQVGAELPVLVSPDVPGRVLPDYQALRRERAEGHERDREADAARQRALLGRDR